MSREAIAVLLLSTFFLWMGRRRSKKKRPAYRRTRLRTTCRTGRKISRTSGVPGGTTYLYRLTDRYGTLLYIGITNNPDRRMEQHASTKPWWDEVRYGHLEVYRTRAQALAAERTAIRQERPLYNLVHNR